LKEAEKRPAQEDLDKAVQQEANKYKDYVKLTPREQEKLKATGRNEAEYQELSQQLQTEKEKNKILAEKLNDLSSPISINDEEIIKKVGEMLNSALNPLQLEIAELKKQLINSPLSESS